MERPDILIGKFKKVIEFVKFHQKLVIAVAFAHFFRCRLLTGFLIRDRGEAVPQGGGFFKKNSQKATDMQSISKFFRKLLKIFHQNFLTIGK